MFLSIIIPAYNEKKRLPETLKKVRNYLAKQKYEYEVLVVNDGSADGTAEIISQFINSKSAFRHATRNPKQILNHNNQNSNFKLISYKPNRGKGFAVKTGMLAAKGDWRLLMDADNSTDISEVEKLWEYARHCHLKDTGCRFPSEESQPTRSASLLNHAARPARVTLSDNDSLPRYEIIIGSRYLNKDSIKIKQPLGRRVVSRLGNFLVRILLGIKSVDTQCGFKLFSAEATKKIFPLQTIDRWGFDMEILAIAVRKGHKIKEVAVDWYDDADSRVKKGQTIKTLKELMAIKWNLIRGKY